MNHHLAKTYRSRKIVVILVILFILLFIGFQKGFLGKLSPFFSRLAIPVWRAENFSADFLAEHFDSKSNLYKQNILLKDALKEKDTELLQLKTLEQENADLKEVLGRTKKENPIILAAILAKPNITPYDVLIIDEGEASGVKAGDLVFAKGDVVLGEIESVEKESARVLMYSTPGNISQVILGATGKYFNAHGLGGGSFEVDLPRELEVKEGDNFFYPGLDNVLLGIVRKVDFDSRDSFRKIIIQSPVNIQEERWVEVRI